MENDTSAKEFRLISLIAFAVLAVGTVFYHFIEHFSWLNALYFCVVTLATVGYGDLTPKTVLGKLFTIVYILIGIGIIAFFANTLIKRAYYRRMERMKKKQ